MKRLSAWRKCAETEPWGLNITYMQTPIYIRQTGLHFLSLSYFQHYSVCFTWKWWSYWKKKNMLNVLLFLQLNSLCTEITTLTFKHASHCLACSVYDLRLALIIFNTLIMMLKGWMASSFFPFWHVSCISMHLYNILHALSFAGWHMMTMQTICTKMVDLWIAWCCWKCMIDSSL